MLQCVVDTCAGQEETCVAADRLEEARTTMGEVIGMMQAMG